MDEFWAALMIFATVAGTVWAASRKSLSVSATIQLYTTLIPVLCLACNILTEKYMLTQQTNGRSVLYSCFAGAILFPTSLVLAILFYNEAANARK